MTKQTCWYCNKKPRLKDMMFCKDCIKLKDKPDAQRAKKGRNLDRFVDYSKGHAKHIL